MAHVVAPNLRGRGISETKKTKTGEPKHAGNWSQYKIHAQSLKCKDYKCYLKTDENGIEQLIVGDHTPLRSVMGEHIEALVLFDKHFESYVQSGVYKIGGKEFDMKCTLRKCRERRRYGGEVHDFILRIEVYTDGYFTYNFPEY